MKTGYATQHSWFFEACRESRVFYRWSLGVLQMSLQLVSFVGDVVQRVQDILDFKGTPSQLKHFKDEMSLGRVGVCGFLLGLGFGGHLCGIVISICAEYFLGSVWWHLPLLSWSTYVAIMCNFHFLEFFITAVRQSGNKLSCNSFVLNHSKIKI